MTSPNDDRMTRSGRNPANSLTRRIYELTGGQFGLVVVVGVVATLMLFRQAEMYEGAAFFSAMAKMNGIGADSTFARFAMGAGAPQWLILALRVGAWACGIATVLVAYVWLGRSKATVVPA